MHQNHFYIRDNKKLVIYFISPEEITTIINNGYAKGVTNCVTSENDDLDRYIFEFNRCISM